MMDISSNEPYIDGFEITGSFLRKREKSKESSNEFHATFANDTWNKNFPRPVSNLNFNSVLQTRPLIKLSKMYPKSSQSSNKLSN